MAQTQRTQPVYHQVHTPVPHPWLGLGPMGQQLPASSMQALPSWLALQANPALMQQQLVSSLLQVQQHLQGTGAAFASPPATSMLPMHAGFAPPPSAVGPPIISSTAPVKYPLPTRDTFSAMQPEAAMQTPPTQTTVPTCALPAPTATVVSASPTQPAQAYPAMDIGGTLSRLNQTLASLDTRLQAPAPTAMQAQPQQAASLTAPTINQGASFSTFVQSHLMYIKPLDANTMVLSQAFARR